MLRADREIFKEIVAAHIAEGLHTRRGLSVAEYTAICRKAWDECPTRPGFTRKILIDPLRSIEGMLSRGPEDYVHWRIGDHLELERSPSSEIRCIAVGTVQPDFSPGPQDEPALPEGEPENPEIRRYMLAVFDVLGFSAWLERVGLREIETIYERLIDEAVTKESMRSYNSVRLNSTELASVLGRVPIRHAHFSDTIVLWVPLVQHFIGPFMARCADLVSEALRLGVPLRGALSVGKAVLHERTSTFVGSPIVEAAKLEQAQNWVGACLGPSMLAADVAREFDPNLVLPFSVPFKKGRTGLVSGLALDWPRRYLTRFGESPAAALRALDTSPAHHLYYGNAMAFAEHSAGPLFRGDNFSLNLNSLAASVLDARQTAAPLSHHNELALRDLARSGEVGKQVADFLRKMAESRDLGPIPKVLPPLVKNHLRRLVEATKGEVKSIKLVACLVDVVLSQLNGEPISQNALNILAELDKSIGDGPATATFLRELAAGARPRIPQSARPDLKSILRAAITWVERREVPPGLLESVTNDCVRIAIEPEEKMSLETLHSLSAIEATGGIWIAVAKFLHEVAKGQRTSVPPELPEPLRSNLQRVAIAALPAGVQQSRVLEVVAIGFGDPPSGLNLWELVSALQALREHNLPIPEEIEKVILEFETVASERKAISDRLRGIVSGAPIPPPPPPDSLPRAVYIALLQIDALVAGKPIPVAPELVGFAAIHARFAERKLGDCMLLSLIALAKSGGESAKLAEYIWAISRGGPAGPAPELHDPELARTAEEVRCLAEPAVGGIRMLFTPITPGAQATIEKGPTP